MGNFSFFPKCQVLDISHLIFADDLFLLCGADVASFSIIHDLLRDFYSWSGLQPNLGKSAVYFAGVSAELKSSLQAVLNIPEGKLPVKYLGVPLISTRLHAQDCQELLEKILAKVHSWANKLLSYGCRIQLIYLVLFSTQIDWSSIFILSTKVLKSTEKVLRSFFWAGPDMTSTGAKVKWEDVCLPKEQGGLGFRKLTDWNKAAMVKNIWAISKKADTLWVHWIHTYVIKERCFWAMKCPPNVSWLCANLDQVCCWQWDQYLFMGG